MARLSGEWVAAGPAALHAADVPVPAGPLPLAEHELLDLAGRGLRQVAELDRVRALEVGEVLAAERDDLLARSPLRRASA